MKQVEAYVETLFKKLPHTRTYRELKNNVLMDCADKYEDYRKQYGEEAEKKIIEEIGSASEYYHGGYYLIDWIYLFSIVFILGFMLFTLFVTKDAREAYEHFYSAYSTIYGVPIYMILVLPRYFKGILLAYSICSLLFVFKIMDINKLTRYIKDWLLYLSACILWGIFLYVLIYFIIHGSFLTELAIHTQYYFHGPLWQLADVVFGILLSLSSGFAIARYKQKRLR